MEEKYSFLITKTIYAHYKVKNNKRLRGRERTHGLSVTHPPGWSCVHVLPDASLHPEQDVLRPLLPRHTHLPVNTHRRILTTAEVSLPAMYQDRLHSRSVAIQAVSSISDSRPVLTNALACTVCACLSATTIQSSGSGTAGLKRKGGPEFRWILPKGPAKEGAIHSKRGAFTPRSKPHCPFDLT